MWRLPPLSDTIRRVPPLYKPISMSATQNAPTQISRRPRRADAARNYDNLVAAAREAFTEEDRSAALEDIARRAGVGIGTLYRNFPTRRDLIEAVYVDEVEQLSASAEHHAPLAAREAAP